MNFCSHCGERVKKKVPKGDNRERFVCDSCGTIHYQNPLIVTGTLPVYKDRVLLCKRAIEPRKGYWTLPAGFMELGETLQEGALRETLEEAGATPELGMLYTLFNVVHVGQLSVFFLAELTEPEYFAGEESEEVALFSEAEIPWEQLAFSTVTKTLRYFFSDLSNQQFSQRIESIQPVSAE